MKDKRSNIVLKPTDFLVLLGLYDLKNNREPGRTPFFVQSINIHPDWHTFVESYDADIAVLVLVEQVVFTKFIQPMCLIPSQSLVASINIGVVIGYGKSEDETKINENIPKILSMPIHKNEDCFLKNFLLARFSSRRTFCGGTGSGVGVCNGDSGGGLFVLYNGVYYLRGIVSASLFNNYRQCDVNNYSIFTDMLNFNEWVLRIGS